MLEQIAKDDKYPINLRASAMAGVGLIAEGKDADRLREFYRQERAKLNPDILPRGDTHAEKMAEAAWAFWNAFPAKLQTSPSEKSVKETALSARVAPDFLTGDVFDNCQLVSLRRYGLDWFVTGVEDIPTGHIDPPGPD